MQRKPLVIVLVVLVLATVVAGGLYWRWLHSPRYALQQMVLALQAKDMNKFFSYLDLKEVFNNIIQASSKDLGKNDPEADEWTQMTRRLGQKFARHLLPKLFEAFEQQIKDAAQSYLLNLDSSQILGLTAAVTLAKIRVTGDEAEVTFQDPKTGDPLRFKMHRVGSGPWRIVSINYNDLKKFLKREFQS